MDKLASIEPMSLIILLAALLISVLVLFARFIHFLLKLAIIGVMAAVAVYFLRMEGVL